MATYNTITSTLNFEWNEGSYEADRDLFIKERENIFLLIGDSNYQVIHDDTEGIPTVGYGYNLMAHSINEITEYFLSAYQLNNISELSLDQQEAINILTSWKSGQPYPDGNGVILTNQDIINGAAGNIPELSVLTSLSVTDAQASIPLNGLLGDPNVSTLGTTETDLSNTLGTINNLIPPSIERIVLISLYYQNPSLIGSGLISALENDNRAEAWYQIRYGHTNTDSEPLQNRRALEAETFRLTTTENILELKEAVGYLYTTHYDDIKSPSSESQENRDFHDSFELAISNEKLALEAEYSEGNVVDFIYLGTDSSSHSDRLLGNDLIFAEESSSSSLYCSGIVNLATLFWVILSLLKRNRWQHDEETKKVQPGVPFGICTAGG